ncbi:uncharacterized protein LOC6050839 isoform X6 [Culex quinquefasciatus]|uniref:uncharacterized protein LOC6050839 isoform X6 n=1 Tax=Culex quinquefasciatus TaxID=7176 RepID=UPI0018E3DA2E|nr:uncharacterized protein LOC6050839 isoform X6 [Culex quinquefasciatus]
MAQVPARNPKYSAADLWPPGSKDRDFPPAAFFPVYVGNFLCQQRTELVARVQQYFASKGLLARMVFVRSAQNDPFQSYQDKTKLYDCLVYLTREKDAQDAVKYLHRDKYYGHRLNVFPGRFADRMRLNRSAGYVLPDVFASWPDTLIEEHIEGNTEAIITCSRRASGRHLIVQYDDVQQLQKALSRYPYLEPYRLDRETMQRFVELNVMDEIRHRIRNNPGFMVMCPERHVLEALYTGSSPDVPTDWAHCTELPAVQPVAVPSKAKQLIIAKAIKKNFRVKCTFNKKPKRNIPVKAQLPWQTAMQEESAYD